MNVDSLVGSLRKALAAFGAEYAALLDLAVGLAKSGDPDLACELLYSINAVVKKRTGIDIWKTVRALCRELADSYKPGCGRA